MKQKKLFFNELLRRYNKYRNRFARLAQTGKNINRQHLLEKRIASMYEKLQSLQRFIKLRTAVAATALTLFAFQPEAKAQTRNFSPVQTNPFSLTATGASESAPAFADLDGDGDMDMLSGSYAYNYYHNSAANFYYYENTGSNTAPVFAADVQNPFGLAGVTISDYIRIKPTFVDLDHDGDMDLMVGNYDGNFYYYENTGTSAAPAFAAPQTNPFGLVAVGAYGLSSPTFVDIDNDGDFDMVSGDVNGNFHYYQNTGTASAAVFSAPQTNPFSLTRVNYWSGPTFTDIDNDGDMDMLAAAYYGDFTYFENTGTNAAPAFATAQTNPFNITNQGNRTTNAFVDLDHDGFVDVMAGNSSGNFYFFKGGCGAPSLNINSSTGAAGNVCTGTTSIVLTATSSSSTYTWSANAGSATTNTVSVNPTVNATYYVSSGLTTNSLCISRDSITIFVKPVIKANYTSIATCPATNDTISAADFFKDGLVAYYPFNGNANDLSGNNHTATAIGVTPGTDRFGNATGCYQFSGTSTYVQCPADTYFQGDFTISGWANVSALGSWCRLMDFGNGPGADNILVALSVGNDNRLGASVYKGGSGSDVESQQVIGFNQWVQVLVTLRGTNRVVYYNGVAIDSTTTSFIPNNVVRNNCYIGLSNWNNDGGITGSLDDIRIYDHALNATEVSNLYNYELTAETPQTTYNWSNGATTYSIITTPNVTTTYSVTETGFNTTCGTFSVTNVITVTVATPTVIAAATATAVCAGNSTTLTGSGAATYTWSNGVTNGTATTPTATTQYTVTGTAANGCMDSDTITVHYNELPTVTANATATTVCAGDPTTLTGSGAATYTWTNGVTNGTATTPTATTQYTVTGTDGNGCVDSDIITVHYNALPTVTAAATATTVCAGDQTTLTGGGASTYVWSNGVNDGVATTPTGTTNYTVTGTDGNGCMNDAVITVTVNPLPILVLTNQAICAGTTTTLTASGGLTYTFSSGPVVTPTTTTSYTIAGTDNNNCTNTAVATLTVNTLPSVVFNVSPSTLCSTNSSVTLNGSPAGGTFTGTGVSAGSFNPGSVAAGTYTLSYNYTDANGCANIDTAVVAVQICLGINNYATNSAVTVYPNPSNGVFTISTTNLAENTTLVIYNGIGQIVYTQLLNKSVETLNTNLASGFYTLKLQSAEGISTQRIIIGQ